MNRSSWRESNATGGIMYRDSPCQGSCSGSPQFPNRSLIFGSRVTVVTSQPPPTARCTSSTPSSPKAPRRSFKNNAHLQKSNPLACHAELGCQPSLPHSWPGLRLLLTHLDFSELL